MGGMSPETAAVKRASALESRRFLDSTAEAEAEARRTRTLFDGGDDSGSSPSDDESVAAAPVRGLCDSGWVKWHFVRGGFSKEGEEGASSPGGTRVMLRHR